VSADIKDTGFGSSLANQKRAPATYTGAGTSEDADIQAAAERSQRWWSYVHRITPAASQLSQPGWSMIKEIGFDFMWPD